MKGGSRRVHWVKLIEDHGVDLLLVQESYPHGEHLLPHAYPRASHQTAWEQVGTNRWGSGIYSRSGSVKPITVPGFSGWVVGARICKASWQGKSVPSFLAFSVHAPAGKGGYWGQVNRLLDAIQQVSQGHDIVIGGDFNILVSQHPENERSVRRQEIAIHQRLSEEFQLLNCWQTANPGQQPYQTLRWTGNRTIPYHCDGIFVPKSWKQRLVSCEVLNGAPWDALSDHNPVVASIA